MTSETLVRINCVSKHFTGGEKAALNNISASITAGKITGLVGPDGAGKTTLIRLMTGLMHPDSGNITVNGFDTKTQARNIHKTIGYMPQKFGLYEDLTVMENLKLYAELRNTKEYEHLIFFTNLAPFIDRLVRKLSGGMKQKLGLACALVGSPKLLLLDEPSVGVDPISRRELWHMVLDLAEQGMGVLWSTSYLDEAERCPEVILLNEGEKLFDGPPGDLLQQVKGRTFQIQGVLENKRRKVLMTMLQQEGVVDGVIQGKHIRIVMAPDCEKPTLKGDATWHLVEPRFEDAFIDKLGGATGSSELAARLIEKPKSDQPAIEAISLTKIFGDFTAVHENSFTIRRGEIFGLLGPNGAGKSTTFKMMCGLLQPTNGRAIVTGLDLKNASSAARSRIGYMAQKFSLYGHLSGLQNLKFFSGLYGLSGAKQQKVIDEMIEIFDLKTHLKQNTNELPLGFKQRLALACAVMHEPDVLFLDEPTSGVDPITRREFWGHINGMVEKGVTIMVTTHFMDEAEYCDRIGLVFQGKNIATGSPDDLKEMVRTQEMPNPTLEDAFITLVENNS